MGWPGSGESGVPASCKPAAAAAWQLLQLETVLEPESVTVTVSELRLHCSRAESGSAQQRRLQVERLRSKEAQKKAPKCVTYQAVGLVDVTPITPDLH